MNKYWTLKTQKQIFFYQLFTSKLSNLYYLKIVLAEFGHFWVPLVVKAIIILSLSFLISAAAAAPELSGMPHTAFAVDSFIFAKCREWGCRLQALKVLSECVRMTTRHQAWVYLSVCLITKRFWFQKISGRI